MIIQNGQNRNLAICNARQVVMLRGGQWIIDGNVLSSAVKSQIYEDIVTTGHHSASLAAEVWRAANLYCKSHAASHPDLTAQGKLLSAFVNADKDMYCSLPLALTPEAQSAMPQRKLIGDGNAYIDLGFKPTAYGTIEVKYQLRTNRSSYGRLIGSGRYAIANRIAIDYENNVLQIGWFGVASAWTRITDILATDLSVHTYKYENGNFYVDGVLKATRVMSTDIVSTLNLFLFYSGDATGSKQSETDNGKCLYLDYIDSNGNNTHHFITCKNPNGNDYGVLDICNLQWYGNAATSGSFTIEKS